MISLIGQFQCIAVKRNISVILRSKETCTSSRECPFLHVVQLHLQVSQLYLSFSQSIGSNSRCAMSFFWRGERHIKIDTLLLNCRVAFHNSLLICQSWSNPIIMYTVELIEAVLKSKAKMYRIIAGFAKYYDSRHVAFCRSIVISQLPAICSLLSTHSELILTSLISIFIYGQCDKLQSYMYLVHRLPIWNLRLY